MSPNDIKHIVNCVVDYGWPVQIGYEGDVNDEYWETMEYENVEPILVVMGHILDYDPIRLDPNHPHDWPIETRESMPCWVRQCYDDEWSKWGQGIVFSDGQIYLIRDPDGISEYVPSWDKTDIGHEIQTCSPHPLNPTMEPPSDWMPEGKRILK